MSSIGQIWTSLWLLYDFYEASVGVYESVWKVQDQELLASR